MATVSETNSLELIGETAGEVWKALDKKGPLSITKIVKEVNAPRDVVMQALGWLAREDKIVFDNESRTKTVALR